MSHVIAPPPQADSTPPRQDLFRYGWRDILHKKPDGTLDLEQVPLTLEDVLHPQMGDVILESSLHDLMRVYVANIARARLAHDPGALVLSDTGVYWDIEELRHHSPDVAVIFGVKRRKDNWPSFHVAEEGVRPRILLEIVSPNTRENDVVTKFAQYYQAGVAICVIIDQEAENGPWSLKGYQRTPRRYLPMAPDDRGRMWLEDLGIWLGLEDNRLVCYDGETDEAIADYMRLTEQFQDAKEQVEVEKAQVEAEKAKVEAEKAKVEAEKAKVEAEKAKVEAEKAKVEAEKVKVQAEKARADAAEKRTRELEELLANRTST